MSSVSFLQTLFAGYPDGLQLEIRPLIPKKQEAILYPNGDAPWNWATQHNERRWFRVNSYLAVPSAVLHCARLAHKYDVYFGVLPRQGQKGNIDSVPGSNWIWCDVDAGTDNYEAVVAKIKASKLPTPNAAVRSGTAGLHCYWKLSEYTEFPDREARDKFKALLKRLCATIGGEAPACHADGARADVASILRVPDTYNQKTSPVPVKLVRLNLAETFTYERWGAILPTPPAPPQRPHRETLLPGETRDLPPKALEILNGIALKGEKHQKLRELLAIARICGWGEMAIESLAREFTSRNQPWGEAHWKGLVKDTMTRLRPA